MVLQNILSIYEGKIKMSFKSIFISVFLGTALIVTALIFNAKRPSTETSQPSPDFVRATGKCATCHRRETSSIIHQTPSPFQPSYLFPQTPHVILRRPTPPHVILRRPRDEKSGGARWSSSPLLLLPSPSMGEG